MSGVIVGISGGDLASTASLNEYAIKRTGKEHPHVLFIPTASNDAKRYIDNIQKYYQGLECTVSALCVVTEKYEKKEIENIINDSDLIYIGGGDTEQMIKIWREYGVDKLIQKAYIDGKVLTGISAGAILWFSYAFSDSDYFKNPESWDYKFVKCFDIFQYAICPHYNEKGRSSFDDRIKELGIDGIALENETAIIIENNHMYIKKAREDARAYLFKNNGGVYQKIQLTNQTFTLK